MLIGDSILFVSIVCIILAISVLIHKIFKSKK